MQALLLATCKSYSQHAHSSSSSSNSTCKAGLCCEAQYSINHTLVCLLVGLDSLIMLNNKIVDNSEITEHKKRSITLCKQ
jgi:hypothetical protein